MKLKHLIYSVCLAGVALTSCQKEDALENVVDTTSPYVLDYLKDSTDEIDQRRYEIFKTYGVPVFFNDVITEEVVGTDYKGDPIYKRETLDIAWDFYSKNPGATFFFNYIFASEEDMADYSDVEKEFLKAKQLADAHVALDYVETYLSMAAGAKPFSILLLRNLEFNGIKEFYMGYRTLYISNAASYKDEASQRLKSGEIINATILPLVQKNEALMEEFEALSEENHYYNKKWEDDLGETLSADLKAFFNSPFFFKLSDAYDEARLTAHVKKSNLENVYNYWTLLGQDRSEMYNIPSTDFAVKYYNNVEALRELAEELVNVAANYGFVGGGWSNDTSYSPNLDNDVSAYVKTILQLGAGGFEARYGKYSLVMQKFELLRSYIENDLGQSLDYNNVN